MKCLYMKAGQWLPVQCALWLLYPSGARRNVLWRNGQWLPVQCALWLLYPSSVGRNVLWRNVNDYLCTLVIISLWCRKECFMWSVPVTERTCLLRCKLIIRIIKSMIVRSKISYVLISTGCSLFIGICYKVNVYFEQKN